MYRLRDKTYTTMKPLVNKIVDIMNKDKSRSIIVTVAVPSRIDRGLLYKRLERRGMDISRVHVYVKKSNDQ